MINAVLSFYGTSVGKKIVVAVTGVLMILFLLGHMVGNLQIFSGRGVTPELTKLNEYAEFLRREMAILWVIRIGLLAIAALHVVTTIKLTQENRMARPVEYHTRNYVETNLASRTMFYGGLVLLFYTVYHILHFTAGSVHADLFVAGDVYSNVVRSFQIPWISGIYLLAQVALFFHLYHGVLSGAQTLGVSHPVYLDLAKKGGVVLGLLITLGFSAVPLAVLFGFVS